MSLKLPAIPLAVAKTIEPKKTWEGVSTPHDLALYIASLLSIDPTRLSLLQEIIYSDVTPTGEDSKKIWIKTNPPIGVGIPSESGYEIIYQYPVNTPILWVKLNGSKPQYLRQLTQDEVESFGLNEPDDDIAIWTIFNP